MALRKYNPKRITGSWTGTIKGRSFAVRFQGFMDGSFVSADYNEAHVTRHDGGHGEASFMLNANRGGAVTIQLVQGSPTNDELSRLIPDADRNYLPIGTLAFDDLNGTTKILSEEACIQKTAAVEFGTNIAGRQWVFECAQLQLFVGGAGDF